MVHLPIIHGDMPSHLRPHADRLLSATTQWLATTEHSIAGRKWRAFWIDDKPSKATKDKPSCNIVYMFAVSGVGLRASLEAVTQRPDRRPMSISDFIDFHAPMKHNIHSTDLKLFARFKLGLSKTTPTVILQKHHFRSIPDKIGDDGSSVMNDGCALMSPSLASAIAKSMGLTEVPSAFQGRIGGAKGLWLVDYQDVHAHAVGTEDCWLQVTPSQNKIMPHPKDRDVCDEYRQFEVNDFAKPPQQTALNTQFLTVLHDRGVKREVLRDCLQEQVRDYYYKDLCEAMSRPSLLQAWVQKYHRSAHAVGGVEMTGAFPRDRSGKIHFLLDAGFNAQDCTAPVRELLGGCIRDHLNLWAQKLRTNIKGESTILYCAADPSGKLKPGQVHCGLSQGWTNPRNGAVSYFIQGVEGLVARNPANHPSDIQRVQFVFIPELQNFRDVLIFPSVGTRSLASLLSGGDYDGDRCLAIWRQDLVKDFVNYPEGPPDHITPESCGLVRRSESLSVLMPHGLNENTVHEFLGSCFTFNLKLSSLGLCTITHEQLVYNTTLTHPGAIKLAALASFLVDSRKQGLELTESAWSKIRTECFGTRPLPRPAYKEIGVSAPKVLRNVIDYLYFGVALAEVDKALDHYHKNWPRGLSYDSYFTSIWTKAWNRAPKDSGTQEILKQLRKDVRAAVEKWSSLVGGNKVTDDPGRYPERVRVCYEQLLAIKPLALPEQDEIHRRYEDEGDSPYSYWRRLRASCFYDEKWDRLLTWYMAGHELCFMNVLRNGGAPRLLTPQMHSMTKVDTRAVRTQVTEIQDEDVSYPSFSGPIVQYLG